MAKQTRYYTARHRVTGAITLVDAANPAQVERHLAQRDYIVAATTTRELPELLSSGATIERARAEQDTAELPLTSVAPTDGVVRETAAQGAPREYAHGDDPDPAASRA